MTPRCPHRTRADGIQLARHFADDEIS